MGPGVGIGLITVQPGCEVGGTVLVGEIDVGTILSFPVQAARNIISRKNGTGKRFDIFSPEKTPPIVPAKSASSDL